MTDPDSTSCSICTERGRENLKAKYHTQISKCHRLNVRQKLPFLAVFIPSKSLYAVLCLYKLKIIHVLNLLIVISDGSGPDDQ